MTCLLPNPPVLSFTSHLKDSRGTSWNPFYFHSPTFLTYGSINGSCPQERAEQHSPKQCCISAVALGHGQHLARVSESCQGGWWRASWEKCFLWMTLEWVSVGVISKGLWGALFCSVHNGEKFWFLRSQERVSRSQWDSSSYLHLQQLHKMS